MSSRRYIKRVWRVPKNRGPVEYLATIVVKNLVKHGWPARWKPMEYREGFHILHYEDGLDLPIDFLNAVEIAVRIAARTYRVDVTEFLGSVEFNRRYRVTDAGFFREVKE